MEDNIKQVIVIRKDLKMGMGKSIVQGAHASMAVLLDQMTFEDVSIVQPPIISNSRFAELSMIIPKSGCLYKWLNGPFTKIVVGVGGEEELLELKQKAEEANIRCALITDSGRTVFHGVLTNTTLAVGPDYSEKIDKITGNLKLL